VHTFVIENQTAQRFVLAQWQKNQAELLSWDNNGYKIELI
jgi:hypothetical protein